MELPAESSHHSVHAMRQQEFALAAPLDVGALYAQNQNKLKLLQVGILGDGTHHNILMPPPAGHGGVP